jgi:integral membrane protein
MDPVFLRYRWMSFITGTTLLSLFVTLLLHKVDSTLWQHISLFVRIDGVLHGMVLYPVYMIVCFQMVLKFKLNIALLGLMFFAGFVPGLAFYLERRMRLKIYPEGTVVR